MLSSIEREIKRSKLIQERLKAIKKKLSTLERVYGQDLTFDEIETLERVNKLMDSIIKENR